MQSNRERFRQSRFSELHPGGDGTKVGNWQVDQLTEKTGMVRVAQKAKVRAHVVQPAQTELAMIAIKRRLKRPAVVHSESRDTGACLHDPSCWLVPEHHRVDIGSAADRGLGVGTQIGPSDAYSLNPDLHFAQSGIFNWHARKPEFQGSDQFRSSHRMLFSETIPHQWAGTRGERTAVPAAHFRCAFVDPQSIRTRWPETGFCACSSD